MAILLNIAAIGAGFMAFMFGPGSPRRMLAFGSAAIALFVWATFLYPPSQDKGLDCDRYGHFANDC